jgi:hypothetical protein
MIENQETQPVVASEETSDKKTGIEVKFDAKKMTLLLGLSESVDPSTAEKLKANAFDPKEELHVTILGFKNGGKIAKALKALPEDERQARVDAITAAAQDTEWSVSPTGELYGIEKQYDGEDEPRRSVVELVDCPQVTGFYDTVTSAVPGVELEVPPTHVTLGTQGNPQGIGLNSPDELSQLGHRLELS